VTRTRSDQATRLKDIERGENIILLFRKKDVVSASKRGVRLDRLKKRRLRAPLEGGKRATLARMGRWGK